MNYGICDLSVLPLRKEATHKSEMISQLLFGEIYEIVAISDDGEWAEISNWVDSYKAWLPKMNVMEVSEFYYLKYIEIPSHKYIQTPFSKIRNSKNEELWLSVGAVLPFYAALENTFYLGDDEYFLVNQNGILSNTKNDLEQIAKRYLNVPYLWGGRSFFGIDCSAFVQQVYKLYNHFRLPRDAYQQAEIGEKVIFEQRKKGDLAFFCNKKGAIDHVGLLLSENKIIHSSGKVRIDFFDEKGILDKKNGNYSHSFHFIKRLIF